MLEIILADFVLVAVNRFGLASKLSLGAHPERFIPASHVFRTWHNTLCQMWKDHVPCSFSFYQVLIHFVFLPKVHVLSPKTILREHTGIAGYTHRSCTYFGNSSKKDYARHLKNLAISSCMQTCPDSLLFLFYAGPLPLLRSFLVAIDLQAGKEHMLAVVAVFVHLHQTFNVMLANCSPSLSSTLYSPLAFFDLVLHQSRRPIFRLTLPI